MGPKRGPARKPCGSARPALPRAVWRAQAGDHAAAEEAQLVRELGKRRSARLGPAPWIRPYSPRPPGARAQTSAPCSRMVASRCCSAALSGWVVSARRSASSLSCPISASAAANAAMSFCSAAPNSRSADRPGVAAEVAGRCAQLGAPIGLERLDRAAGHARQHSTQTQSSSSPAWARFQARLGASWPALSTSSRPPGKRVGLERLVGAQPGRLGQRLCVAGRQVVQGRQAVGHAQPEHPGRAKAHEAGMASSISISPWRGSRW